MTRFPLRRLHALFVIALGGCAGGGHQPAQIELLDGSSNLALADGAAVPLIAGTQGGHHVMLALRGWGVDDGAAQVTIHSSVGTIPVANVNSATYLHAADAASVQSDPLRLILCPSNTGVADRDLTVEIALHRSEAEQASLSLRLQPRCPDDSAADPTCAASCGQP